MKTIELNINYTEPLQFIDERHEITLDNGFDVIFTFSAEIIVKENIGATFYDENQSTIEILNSDIDILEVWDGEELVEYTTTEIKELKKLILENIE